MREAAYQVRDTGMGWGRSRKAHSGDRAWVSPSIRQLFKEDGKGRGTENILVLPGSV